MSLLVHPLKFNFGADQNMQYEVHVYIKILTLS